jgi:Protein of unknown function (DUF2934)
MSSATHDVARVKLRRRPDRRSRNQSLVIPTENIARRAYELFLARGGEHGHDVEDWLRAEGEIIAEQGRA